MTRLGVRAGAAALMVVLAATVLRYLVLAAGAVAYPFGLDYGEGIVWQQMRMMLAGEGYAPLRPYPAIVFHYPPLYHLASAATAALAGTDQLAAGRLLSVLSTLGAAALAAAIVLQVSGRAGWPARLAALCAGAIVLGTKPVAEWSVYMRVDMLSQLLTLAGTALAMLALRRPSAVHGAALCFVAAIFTKQTALDAPLAAFAVLLLARPRTALLGIATGLLASVTALAAATAWTDGAFLRHIVLNNVNRFCLSCGVKILEMLGEHAGFILVAIGGVAVAIRAARPAEGWRGTIARLRAEPRAAALAMLLLQLALATPLLLLRFKSGGSVNYFIGWTTLVAIFDGIALAALFAAVAPGRLARAAPWVLAAQAGALLAMFAPSYVAKQRGRETATLIAAALARAPGPVVSDDMVALLRAGKAAVLEPSIFAELSGTGALDERRVLRRIEAGGFAAFLTEGDPGERVFDSRYRPDFTAAMTLRYPQVIPLGKFRLRLPPGPLPAWAAPLAGGTP